MNQFSAVSSVTVTYFPDIEQLQRQLRALPEQINKIIVDNTGNHNTCTELEALAASLPNVHLLCNPHNAGLAAAINQGVSWVVSSASHARFVFLLDQDSVPETDCLPILLKSFEKLETQHRNVGAVGPQLLDEKTREFHGFHQMDRWHWKRIYPPTNAEPVVCTNLNGSGTLMPVELFLRLGSLDERLFIDHVDTEWAFRMLSEGYSLWGIPQAIMRHSMGQSSLKIRWFGRRVWPLRSPLRHRYLFRNTLWLMKRNYVPVTWKLWAGAKLALTFAVHAIFDTQRRAQFRAMATGIYEGFKDAPEGGRPHTELP